MQNTKPPLQAVLCWRQGLIGRPSYLAASESHDKKLSWPVRMSLIRPAVSLKAVLIETVSISFIHNHDVFNKPLTGETGDGFHAKMMGCRISFPGLLE